jgi:hypothetical protein
MHMVRNLFVLLLVVTALLATGLSARAQQDGDVTVIIKAKSKHATLPTLLVLCDLGCDWKLDGEVKGHIHSEASVKVKVEPGQHMVEATTEDGVDQVKQPTTVKPTGQTMVNIELWPIRYARLVAEQEERDKGAQEAQAKTDRESSEKAEQAARKKAAQELAAKEEAERQPWTDAATGLMWTKKGNGESVSWQQAMYYCRNLRLAGYDDWRLPSIDELSGINASEANTNGVCLKGDLLPIGAESRACSESPALCPTYVWSSSQIHDNKGKALYPPRARVFQPSCYGPHVDSLYLEEAWGASAWCVRRPANP